MKLPRWTRNQIRDLLAESQQYGHQLYFRQNRPDRFIGGCSCGYESTGKTSQSLAVESALHHLMKEAIKRDANGVSVPRIVRPVS